MIEPQVSHSIEDFELLTLSAQLEHLTRALEREPAVDLIRLCGPIRDPAPLAWLTRQLLERKWFFEAENQSWFATFLVALPETTVDKLLKALTQQPLSDSLSKSLCELLLKSLKVVPLQALSSMCLLDRTMKHHFSEERDQHLSEIFNTIERLLNSGTPEAIPLPLLAQMPATSIIKFEEVAASVSAACLAGLQEVKQTLAEEAIQILGDAPKAVSQANAEDLLARRVYTDPGHFLIELLQNAEDAGAKVWRVIFDKDKLIIWHDGTPFDTRDLVGITSIGQTTKRKQQIGFFGVGFKSVYEVTDRPQIYSDVFCFEIADVSIPKLLAHRPADLPQDGTAVVLPLRKNLDAERVPKALFEKGVALDACVLLTLRSIDVIDFQLTEAAGGPSKHALIECVSETGTSIRHEPSEKIVSYSIQDDEYNYEGATREAGRPDRSKVMVGMLLDDAGVPVPLPSTAAEVYSYLPTREQPGLRFFVQGHFDVPVDRERIAPDSNWNRWILSQVPAQLARLARRVQDQKDRSVAAGFINVLPLKRDLPNAPFAEIPSALSKMLSDIAFVPVANGKLIAPQQTIVSSPTIVDLFENDSIDDERSFLSPELSERHQNVLLELGAKQFDTPALLDYLEERLLNRIDSNEVPLQFLTSMEKLERLYDLFLTELESLERRNENAELSDWLERLRALPVMPDSEGQLRRPKDLSRGSTFLRKIYAGSRHFVDARLEDTNARTNSFFDRLGLERIDLEYLVCDLEQNIGALEEPLTLPRNAFPQDEECLEQILEALVSADWDLLQRVGRLPLFKAADGRFYRIAINTADLRGVLDASGSKLADDLAFFYGTVRPIATTSANSGSTTGVANSRAVAPSVKLLQRLSAPSLNLSVLAEDLQRGLFKRDSETLQSLHQLLDNHAEDISDKVSKLLVQLPIWPDQNGDAHPLVGDDKVFIAIDKDICEIFSEAPFLDWAVANRKHTSRMNIASVSVSHVIEGLGPDAQPPLLISRNAADVERAIGKILVNSGNVDSTGIRSLREKAVFLSDRGAVLPLSQLSRAESTELRTLYKTTDIRSFIDEEGSSWALIKELGIDNSLISANPETLAEDMELDLELQLNAFVTPEQGFKPILVYLARRVDKMTKPLLIRFTKLPIFPDTAGNTGRLCTDRVDRSPDFVYPCSGSLRRIIATTGLRLLNPEMETIVKPVLIAAKVYDAGLEHLVDWLSEHDITDEDTLDQIQDQFVARKVELNELYPPGDRVTKPNQVMNKLKIWKTLSGDFIGARDIMGGNLSELLEPGTAEFHELQKACVKPAALKRLQALAPLMIPVSPEHFLAELIKRTAKPDLPLNQQPYFLSSVERVTRLYEIVGNRNTIELPSINAAGNLTFSPLFYTDADTLALLRDLPVNKQILHPELTSYFELGKEEPSKFANIRSQVAKLWTKMISTRGFEDFVRLTPLMVIEALGNDMDAKRRARFYSWLIVNRIAVFDDRATTAKLLDSPLFLTKQGNMVKPGDLVFDEDLPDLGIDWLPNQEIPKQLVEILAVQLDVSKPNLDELIKRHVIPAYEEASERADGQQAGRLLLWLARRLSNRSEMDLRRLLKAKRSAIIKIEDMRGQFCLPQELVLPDPEIRTHVTKLWNDLRQPSESRYPLDIHPFLIALGVATTPSLDLITEKLGSLSDKQSLALASVIAHLRQVHGESIYKKLPVMRSAAWLLNGEGKLKSPQALYLRAYEIESLIGPFADLYLDKHQEEILGPSLCKGLGFREAHEIQAADVMNHILYRANHKETVSPRVYGWLDLAASRAEIKTEDFDAYFGDKPWILTDDDEYESHKKVLGTRAFHLFGNLRGYWSRGWKQYPALCKTLGIKDGTTPQSVRSFIEEVGREVANEGSKDILKREPALPLMLVNCFAVLSKTGITVTKDLPIIPAVHKQSVELLPASTQSLYWSDTPTLEALFANVGKLCLARRGTGDDAEDVDAFYTSMGIRRLRDTYKVIAAKKEGGDRSNEMSQQVLSLRNVLRALSGVIPRIELERELNPDTMWVYHKHLRSLSASGSIRAIENLKVRYVLAGVGETEVERPAAYDTERGELLVDSKVLSDPDLTGLSEGLLPAIIDGPSAESFIDLFEILLARRSQDEMSAYLNRRHFAEANVDLSTVDRLAQRIGELLDYGLADKLAKRFKTLAKRDLSKWREPSLIKEIETRATNNIENSASEAVSILLKAIGVEEKNVEIETLLHKLLVAQTISDCSELLVVEKTSENADLRETEGEVTGVGGADGTDLIVRRNADSVSSIQPSKSLPSPSTPAPVAPPAKQEQDTSIKGFFDYFFFGKKQPEESAQNQSAGSSKSKPDGGLSRENQDASATHAEGKSGEGRTGGTGKDGAGNNVITGDFGRKDRNQQPEPELPSWLLGNYFKPSKVIHSQIWYTSRNCKSMESIKKDAFIHFSPGRLPSPHLYSVNKLGASFNPILQSWTFGKSAQKYFLTPGTPSGRLVSFSGRLYAGKSRLPLPLYSKLHNVVTVTNGTLISVTHDLLGVIVDLAGEGMISISYDVEILNVPQLHKNDSGNIIAAPDKALLSPTVPLSHLPDKAVKWVNEMNSSPLSDSKRALAAQDFIRTNYVYDADFLEREDVRKRKANLPFLSGNHHLELLHASGDEHVLGRGVCYELNVLLVELLRHLRIPACIAVGWVLDEGVVDLSDHLFALALVGSTEGNCILPLDAAATDRGPIRTIQRRRFPQPAKNLKARPTVPTVKGSWDVTPKKPAVTEEGDRHNLHQDWEHKQSQNKSKDSIKKIKEDNIFKRLGQFAENKLLGSESKSSNEEKTIPKSAADMRIAEERRLRKEAFDILAVERTMRQRAESKLGEERRLRRLAEERLKNTDDPDGLLDSEAQEAARLAEEQRRKEQEFRVTEPKRQAEEYNLLCKAYDYVLSALGLESSNYPLGSEGLRQKLIKLLGSTAVLDTYLGILRGDGGEAKALTDELKFLEDLRLIEIETIPTLMIHVVESIDDDDD